MSSSTNTDYLTADTWELSEGVTIIIMQNPLRTRVHKKAGAPFKVPTHWHAAHDEEHVVIKGRLIVMQDGVKRVLTPEDGVCKTPRGMVHSLEGYTDEEFIIEETSTNEELSEQKTYFFRNLAAPGITKSPLGILQVLYHGDGYPKFPTGLRWLESPIMTFLGGYLAPALGYKIPDPRLQLDRKNREKKKNY